MADERWQPVEGAPKNGTAVLVYMKGTAGLGIYRAVFTSWSIDDGEPRLRWRPLGYTALDEFPQGATITHWMPLPDPPKAEGQIDG